MIRPFDWRDFPRLHRYRAHGIWLNNAAALTQWQIQVPVGALFAYLAPATGVFTYVAQPDGAVSPSGKKEGVIGQVSHLNGGTVARLVFITPEFALESAALPELLDYLAVQSARRGAQNLLAEVEEHSPLFEVLRLCGYGVFCRQRIWRMPTHLTGLEVATPWRSVTSQDGIAIRALYSAVVPPLTQQMEMQQWEQLNGYVYYDGDDLLGFISVETGPRGVLAQPYIHPSAENVSGRLAALLHYLAEQGSRPVYLVVRSYLGWLDNIMNQLGADASPGQAVMAKRMAVAQKAQVGLKIPAIEGARPEITT